MPCSIAPRSWSSCRATTEPRSGASRRASGEKKKRPGPFGSGLPFAHAAKGALHAAQVFEKEGERGSLGIPDRQDECEHGSVGGFYGCLVVLTAVPRRAHAPRPHSHGGDRRVLASSRHANICSRDLTFPRGGGIISHSIRRETQGKTMAHTSSGRTSPNRRTCKASPSRPRRTSSSGRRACGTTRCGTSTGTGPPRRCDISLARWYDT